MKNTYIFIISLLLCAQISAQVTYEKFESRKLNSTRELQIKLPKNYDPESDLKHPVIIVFDAEYLFEPVVGQVSYQTYFDEMPESIIVGIVQGEERFYDSYYDEVSGLPFESGDRFYKFVDQELIPYIDSQYNTSKFKVAVGEEMHPSLFTKGVKLIVVDNKVYRNEGGTLSEAYYLTGDFSVIVPNTIYRRVWLDYLKNAFFVLYLIAFAGSAYYLSKTKKKNDQDVIGFFATSAFSVIAGVAIFFLLLIVLTKIF